MSFFPRRSLDLFLLRRSFLKFLSPQSRTAFPNVSENFFLFSWRWPTPAPSSKSFPASRWFFPARFTYRPLGRLVHADLEPPTIPPIFFFSPPRHGKAQSSSLHCHSFHKPWDFLPPRQMSKTFVHRRGSYLLFASNTPDFHASIPHHSMPALLTRSFA